MGIFSGIGKALGNVGKAVGKVAGTAVKSVAKVASPLISNVPVVGDVYKTATSLVGVDPVQLLGNSVNALVSGGNIGKALASGYKEAQRSSQGCLSPSPNDLMRRFCRSFREELFTQ